MKAKILYAIGMVVSILPPCLTVIEFIPIWVVAGDKPMISGIAVILLALCCIPFWRAIKNALKSPSPWMLWGIFLLLTILTKNIINQMYIVAMVAFPSSIAGAVLFYFSKKAKGKEVVENG